jgi:succinoglycan biosynthesis transport protein ExoP
VPAGCLVRLPSKDKGAAAPSQMAQGLTSMEIFDKLPSNNAYSIGDLSYRRSEDDSPANLREILTKFWVRKRLIFASILVGAGLAFGTAKLITPTFTGEALLMVKPQQSSGLLSDANPAVPVQTSPEAVQNETFVLQSRALASDTIERLHLDRDSEFDPSLRKPNPLLTLLNPVMVLIDKVQSRLQSVTGFSSGAGDTPPASDEIAIEVEGNNPAAVGKPSAGVVNAFMSRLHVTVQQKSNVIQVSFKSSRPVTAALVPNTLIQLYLGQLASEKDKTLAQESERLDNLVLPTLRQKMGASELALADYRQKSGLVIEQNPTVLGQELSETKGQLAIARARTAEASVRLSKTRPESATATASPATASESPTLQRLREQEVNLQAQLAALRGSLGPNHPKTLQLEAQLKELKDGIRREGAGHIDRLKTELAAAQATEMALNNRVAEFTRQFALVNGGDTQLQSLIAEADANRKSYERLLARSNELHSIIGHARPDASLVSRADVPLKPSSDTKLIVMVGTVIGAGVGIILVSLLDGLLGGLRNKEQVEEALGIKCLGLVPRLKRSRRNRRPAPFLELQETAFGQAIRNVQVRLLSFDGRKNSRVVLVTAALPGEGKTWVAASLAASLAADGISVALVDCDLYRPTLHRMFDGPSGPGLTDYFAGDVTLDQIAHYDRSGVTYIPAGAALSKEAWRITSGRLRPLIERLEEKYTFIIFDSAPVLAVSETMLLSQIARKTILVVKWGSTPPAIARHAAMQLLDSGDAEIAVLLSMVNTKRAARYGDPVAGVYKRLESYYRR